MTSLAEIGSRTLKNISTLESNFQRRARQWLEEMIQTGIRPLVYCGLRTMEEQAALYAIGRSKGGKIVTKAKPGESYHNYGLALDWVAMKQAPGTDLYEADWNDETAFKLGERVGVTFNLTAISWETGHLQDGRFCSWRNIPAAKVETPTLKTKTPTTGRSVRLRKP